MTPSQTPVSELWRKRVAVPSYMLKDAARYAHISTQTVRSWHRLAGTGKQTLSERDARTSLSYLQLIEVAVVSAFRQMNVPLKNIREAREFAKEKFGKDYPFAQYRFKTDGKTLLLPREQVDGPSDFNPLIEVNRKGQLAWDEIIGSRLQEFDYEESDIVTAWHVAGRESPIVISPKVSFGAPSIRTIPVWAVGEAFRSGQPVDYIADDLDLDEVDVVEALRFEGLMPTPDREAAWTH